MNPLPAGFPDGAPPDILACLEGARIEDRSSSPCARVFFLNKGNGLYLKCSGKGLLEKEALFTRYFFSKGLGPEVVCYYRARHDWLLTCALPGKNASHPMYLEHPARLCDTLALELRALHEADVSGCPVTDRTADYLAAAQANAHAGKFCPFPLPDSFARLSAPQAKALLAQGAAALQSRVLLHGDYCLPNVILDNWALSGFVDLGCGGVGDRHIDLFWGVWSLWFNLKTNRYCSRFLDAYGRDRADEDVLQLIAAAEAFAADPPNSPLF